MKNAAVRLIRMYQRWISPALMPACRYTPTCSHYAAEAIEIHGARGLLLAGWRLLRCHPFSRGGFDPVPLPRAIVKSVCQSCETVPMDQEPRPSSLMPRAS